MAEIASHQRSQCLANMLLIMLKTHISLILGNKNTALSFQWQILTVSDKIKMASNPSKYG